MGAEGSLKGIQSLGTGMTILDNPAKVRGTATTRSHHLPLRGVLPSMLGPSLRFGSPFDVSA